MAQGVRGVGDPKKTFLLLIPPKGPCSIEDVLDLHLRPPGHKMLLRIEETLSGHALLLANHPDYQQGKEAAQIYMEDALRTNLVAELDAYGIVEVMEAGAVGQADDLNHFTLGGPRLARLISTVLPYKEAQLPAAALQLLQMPGLEAQLAAILDPLKQAGVVLQREGVTVQREVPISLSSWVRQRVTHIHRAGPANQPVLLFALLHVLQAEQMLPLITRGQAGLAGPPSAWLSKLPGSYAYLQSKREDLAALRRWLGAPFLSITLSMSAATSDLLGTAISHQAGVEGRNEQVWHVRDESEKLHPRAGKAKPAVTDAYFIHTRSQIEDDSCPYHPYCARTSLEDRREW